MTEPNQQTAEGLTEGDFLAADEPFVLFSRWYAEAEASEPRDANAMALATADADGLPNVRMVLLKSFGPEGLVFFTNLESQKGAELAINSKAAVVLYWKSLNRQIRARGLVEPVSDAEADVYFKSRPRGAQIGAWASRQSRPLQGRFELETAIAKTAARHAFGDVPRPSHWSGFRIIPLEIEFWADRKFRLHDRFVFRRKDSSASWEKTRLYP